MAERAPSTPPEPLGLAARGVVDAVVTALRFEDAGIHFILSDRPEPCRKHLVAAVEAAGLPARPLLAGDDTRLDDAARRPPPGGQVLVEVLDPRDPARDAATRALNLEREWLTAPGNHTVLILPGTDRRDCDDAYLALQRQAPDFWSLRTALHPACADDAERAFDGLVERLSAHFGDREAAERWLAERDPARDWAAFRLWLPEQDLAPWIAAASLKGDGEAAEADPTVDSVWTELSLEPEGEPIPPARWPAVVWPSGRLDAAQDEVVEAARQALAADGAVRIYRREAETPEAVAAMALTVGLLVRSRYARVVHLAVEGDLASAIWETLAAIAPEEPPPDACEAFPAVRRLRGALAELRPLLIVTGLHPVDADLLDAGLHDVPRVLAVEPLPVFHFALVTPPEEIEAAKIAQRALNRWPLGAILLPAVYPPLALREASGRALYTVVCGFESASLEAHGAPSMIRTDTLDPEALTEVATARVGPPVFPAHAVCLPSDRDTARRRIDLVFREMLRGAAITNPRAPWVGTWAALRTHVPHIWTALGGISWLSLIMAETYYAGALAALGVGPKAVVPGAEAMIRGWRLPRATRAGWHQQVDAAVEELRNALTQPAADEPEAAPGEGSSPS